MVHAEDSNLDSRILRFANYQRISGVFRSRKGDCNVNGAIKNLIDNKLKTQIELADKSHTDRNTVKHFMLGFLGALYETDQITGSERSIEYTKALKLIERC